MEINLEINGLAKKHQNFSQIISAIRNFITNLLKNESIIHFKIIMKDNNDLNYII